MSFILAVHNPIFGGGFKSLETSVVWAGLAQEFLAYPFFYSGDALPHPIVPKAAHSIYFQVMGEHGFGGLLVFVGMLLTAFLKARRISLRAKREHAPAWIATLATMLQLVIFAFALGGSALSFAYFELVYAVFGLLVVLEYRIMPAALAQQRLAQAETAPAGR
jgi:O-antigen ligase